MSKLEEYFINFTRGFYTAAAVTFATLSKFITGLEKIPWIGYPLAAGILVLNDLFDYNFEKDKIAREYKKEIAARLGIAPGEVTSKDLNLLAKENPTIDEALRRSRWRRNLRMAVSIGITAAVMALALTFAGPLTTIATLGLSVPAATIVWGGAISLIAFPAFNFVVKKIGTHLFHLTEPSIKEVEENPKLQNKLSLPSQIHYIDYLLRHRVELTSENVILVFRKANSGMSLAEINQSYDIEQITNDLNKRLIDAQELAFMVHGQSSGVERRESPEYSALEMAYMDSQQRLAAAKQIIAEQAMKYSEVAKNKAVEFGGTMQTKAQALGDATKERMSQTAVQMNDRWRSMFKKNEFDPGKIAAERLSGEGTNPEIIIGRN